jgi:hypothetical protein
VAHKTGLPVCSNCRIDDRSRPYRRAAILKSRYGITLADYDRMLAEQAAGARSAGPRSQAALANGPPAPPWILSQREPAGCRAQLSQATGLVGTGQRAARRGQAVLGATAPRRCPEPQYRL